MPSWSRLTCLFGLPDEHDDSDDILRAALGPILRAASAPVMDVPLPDAFVRLLAQLEQRERHARSRHAAATRTHRRLAALPRARPAPAELTATGTE